MNKYAGLMLIADRQAEMEKRALLDDYAAWQERHPWLALGANFVPGLGSVTSGMDAARDFSQGKVLSGIGNSVWALANLAYPLSVGKVFAKGVKGVRALRGVGKAAPAAAGTVAGAGTAAGTVAGTVAGAGTAAGTAARATRPIRFSTDWFQTKANNLGDIGNHIGGWRVAVPAMGLSLASPLIEGRPPPEY